MSTPSFSRSKLFARYPELTDPRQASLSIEWRDQGFAFVVRGLAPADPRLRNLPAHLLPSIPPNLPFPAETFDHVVFIGGLARQPREARGHVISEMLRVSRKAVFLSSAFEHPGPFGQRAAIEAASQKGGGVPRWLEDDSKLDLPGLSDVMNEVLDLGLPFDVFGDETMLQHYADLLLRTEAAVTDIFLRRQMFMSPREFVLSGNDWDVFHSFAFCIRKDRTPEMPPVRRMASRCISPSSATMNIYACCHNEGDVEDFGGVKVLRVGPAATGTSLPEPSDILHNGTRLLNGRWSELSGIYRIWVDGPRSDVIGFCHYRRFFDFAPREPSHFMKTIHRREIPTVRLNFSDDSLVEQCLSENLVIVPNEFGFEHSPFHQYAGNHNAGDLCLLISLVSKRHPELLPYAKNLFSGRSLFPCNMFIMRWSLFEALCPVWFGLLQEFEAIVPTDRASAYQNRDISFLAERLFDMWLRYAADQMGVKVRCRPTYFVER